MRLRYTALLPALLLTACGASQPTAVPTPASTQHNYAQQTKGSYYYVTAVSDNDKANGQGAGDVVGFRYLGKNDKGEYGLEMLDSEDEPDGEAYCQNPCAVIRMSDGRKMGYSPDTVIGNAFADAFAGHLVKFDPRRTALSQN